MDNFVFPPDKGELRGFLLPFLDKKGLGAVEFYKRKGEEKHSPFSAWQSDHMFTFHQLFVEITPDFYGQTKG